MRLQIPGIGLDKFDECPDYYKHTSAFSKVGVIVGGHPSSLSIDPTRGTIYIIDGISKKISVIEGSTDTLTRTFSIDNIKPDTPGSVNGSDVERVRAYIAIDPVTNLLSVATSYSSLLDIIDAETGNLVTNVTLDNRPTGISSNYTSTQVISADSHRLEGNLTYIDNKTIIQYSNLA